MIAKHESVLEEKWWQVVKIMASFLGYGYDETQLEEDYIRVSLIQQGFSEHDINMALDWLAEAALSGNLSEVLSMLNSVDTITHRVINPLETVSIPDELLNRLNKYKNKGIISLDMHERILEGVRELDTRDWESEDIDYFIKDVISASLPNISEDLLDKIAKGQISELYS